MRRPRRPRDARLSEEDESKHVIAGVRNTEARSVYDRRVLVLRRALEQGDEAALASGLYEARRLALWRARNITDFAAFAEDVVGVDPARAEALAARAGAEQGVLSAELVALWVRSEASLLRVCPDARVGLDETASGLALRLHVPLSPVAQAVTALRELGITAGGLGRLFREPDAPPRAPRGRSE